MPAEIPLALNSIPMKTVIATIITKTIGKDGNTYCVVDTAPTIKLGTREFGHKDSAMFLAKIIGKDSVKVGASIEIPTDALRTLKPKE